ncbi:MAG: TetR/AcrR family transcriptional regulator, partial [Myxococcota bacterium]|jgi:TetR/AcrR family transcriptional repressor of mexJK operon|nr:TetR/AcrR family transcriptional regulator [Myxococcota bacterium]
VPRPTDHAKRHEIADRAFQLVLERGVQAINMSQLARDLHMKRPTLYWYFPDLGSLFDTVVENVEERLLERVVGAMRMETHPLDQLLALLESVPAFYLEDRAVLDGLVQLWAVRPEPRPGLAQRIDMQRSMLTQLVQQGIDEGRVHPCDAAALVETVLTLVDGSVLRAVLVGSSPDQVIGFARDHILEPLRVPTGDSPCAP